MRCGPPSRPGSHRQGLPDNSACLSRMFARLFHTTNPSNDGRLNAPQELTGHRSTKATSLNTIALSALANYQRTSLFLCSVSFLLFRAYDAKTGAGPRNGEKPKMARRQTETSYRGPFAEFDRVWPTVGLALALIATVSSIGLLGYVAIKLL